MVPFIVGANTFTTHASSWCANPVSTFQAVVAVHDTNGHVGPRDEYSPATGFVQASNPDYECQIHTAIVGPIFDNFSHPFGAGFVQVARHGDELIVAGGYRQHVGTKEWIEGAPGFLPVGFGDDRFFMYSTIDLPAITDTEGLKKDICPIGTT